MGAIEKAILRSLTNQWQDVSQITTQVAEHIGEEPNSLMDVVPLFCGILAGQDRIEAKPVPKGDGYYYVCRQKPASQEVPY